MGFDDERDSRKYAGFKGRWDKDLNTFVFESKDERDRWQIKTYGAVRNCCREASDPIDDRPLRYEKNPFWKDEGERQRYERAAHLCPVSASGNLTLDQYLAEIAKLAEGIKPQGTAVKAMPSGPWEDR